MRQDDFSVLRNKNIIYFDNAATTLKSDGVLRSMNDYYQFYTANIHRGLYDSSILVDYLYDSTRFAVRDFIHCSSAKEVVFTSGATHSINLIVFGYMKYHLKVGDEVLLSKAEHASNILPWFRLAEEIGICVHFIPLEDDYSVSYSNVEKSISPKTKVISLAHVTNVVGDERDIYRIGSLCQEKNILFHVDGAQSIPHVPFDFIFNNVDFLSFSAHKMCGPTGVGVLVVRETLLKEFTPVFYGGGMNLSFDSNGDYSVKDVPVSLEAGTPPIAEVLGLKAAIEYLTSIGLDNIHHYECELKRYLICSLEQIPNITLYHSKADSGIVSFNVNGVDPVDVSKYLNTYHICVRSGNHCSKLLKDDLGIPATVRVSLYFYNTKEEIDVLVTALKKCSKVFKVVN